MGDQSRRLRPRLSPWWTVLGNKLATKAQIESRVSIHSEAVQLACPTEKIKREKKKLVRRASADYSQLLRHVFQVVFLLLNIWIGIEFYLWTRYFASGCAAPFPRPAGVDGWLPISGLMNLKEWLLSGKVPEVHPAAMFLLVAFLATAFLLRKSFCSWLCPVGTVSESLWRAGRKLFKKNLAFPRWLDLPLRGLKYVLLGFFVSAVAIMPVKEIYDFMHTPFGLIADVKLLNFFLFIGGTGLIVIAVLVAGSLLVKNFWCRYFCPYGALFGLFALFSPAAVRRNEDRCIDCAKCARACPFGLPVDRLIAVHSAECTGCLECVAACPVEGALGMSIAKMQALKSSPSRLPAWAMAAAIAALFLGIVGYAKLSGHWQTNVPDAVYERIVPHANQVTHPMP